jgi:CrcB protein
MNIVAIFIGGGLGSLCRYAIGKLSATYLSSSFAYATLFSNVLSTLILASFVYLFQDKMGLNNTWKLFVVTGFCGGFSTFSTFSFETFEMLKNGQTSMAVANVVLSVLCCLFILFILYKNQ